MPLWEWLLTLGSVLCAAESACGVGVEGSGRPDARRRECEPASTGALRASGDPKQDLSECREQGCPN
jgi:hypothetical protein